MADPRSNPGGGINGGDPPPPPLYFQQDDSAAAAEAVAAAQLLTTAAAGVAGVAGYAVPGIIGGVPGELESMDLNMLREWLDESFSDNDADVSSSDGGGGSESLMQLLYQHQQQQLGMQGQGQQQHFTGFGFGDESEMKMPAGMSMSMNMPPSGRSGSGSKRQRAAEKRQRAGTNNSGAMATIDVTMSDDDDDEHGKKRTWPNQREELVYLRTKVCTLENELREIKIASRKQFNSSAAMLARFTSADGKGMVACSTPGSLWEQVANRQLDEKVRAEVENRKLRDMVESQIRLAKKLQQLLRKRQIWEGLMEQKPKNEADMKPEESKIYAFLAQKIEDRFPHIDAFFDHHGLTHAMNEAREINVKFDDQVPSPGPGGDPAGSGAHGPGGNMFIEMKECKIMPFDFRAADAAVWRCLKDEIITMHNTSATVIDTDENVLRAKVAVKLAGRGSEVELTVWSLWRRYMEHDRAIYAVESLAITSGTSVPGSPIIQIKQSATAIVRPFTLTSAPVASIVRVYVRSTPSIIQDAAQESAAKAAGHPQVGVLTDMLIGSYHQNVEAMYKAVENLLLDELLKGKMRG